MLCDICNKVPATVHLTEIIDDQITELHLCEKCAREKSVNMEQQFGLADLLAGLAEFGSVKEQAEGIIKIKCANCGLSFADFKKIGRLGCSECYLTFRRYLGPLLKRIHGSNQHVGKAPLKIAKTAYKRSNLEELRDKLQAAITDEEFEKAAKLRDQIKQLEKKEASLDLKDKKEAGNED